MRGLEGMKIDADDFAPVAVKVASRVKMGPDEVLRAEAQPAVKKDLANVIS